MKTSDTLRITIPLMVVLLGFVIYQYGYVRIKEDLHRVREEQEVRKDVLERYTGLVSEIPRLEDKLAALKETRESYNEETVKGKTYSIASASLQETVKGIITGRDGKIMRERIGRPIEMGEFEVITVNVEAAMPDVRALSNAVYSIETFTPALYIKKLDARIRDYRNPKELIIKVNVSALTGG